MAIEETVAERWDRWHKGQGGDERTPKGSREKAHAASANARDLQAKMKKHPGVIVDAHEKAERAHRAAADINRDAGDHAAAQEHVTAAGGHAAVLSSYREAGLSDDRRRQAQRDAREGQSRSGLSAWARSKIKPGMSSSERHSVLAAQAKFNKQPIPKPRDV
jgi:hypothetical protein